MLRARKDPNHDEIVSALRAVGASVHSTAAVGGGFPDLVVGYRGRTYLLEVKAPAGDKRRINLSPGQQRWHADWRGHVAVVRTPADAWREIGVDVASA